MMAIRHRRRKPELNSSINMTNLVDVMLTILIIFILVAPFIEQGIPVALPKSETKEDVSKQDLTIRITYTGEVYIGDVQVSEEVLERKLRAVAAANPNVSVNVQADGRAQYQEIVNIFDIIRRSGITSVGLPTEVKTDR